MAMRKRKHEVKKQNNIEQEADRLVALFLSDEALTEGDRDAIFRWLDGDGNKELWQEALNRYYSSRPASGHLGRQDRHAETVAKGWRQIAERSGLVHDANPAKVVRLRRPQWQRVALRIAAVLIPAALIVGGYFGYGRWMENPEQLAYRTAPVVPFHRTVYPHADSVRTIVLSDGTEVTLNCNSTFSYNDNREGELHGEAYFKVAKDTEHPFVIHSEHMTVTVLGTEFHLNTHTREGSSKLSLYDGAVVLGHAAGTHKLEVAGKEFTLDHATRTHGICDFDHSQKPEWFVAVENVFHFISFGEIFDRVEDEYGVMISGRETVDLNKQLNFEVDEGIPIVDVMSMLEFAHGGFNYTIDGNQVTLRRCE
jgi:ferric-dicitrate binding protein FerR (iron transport regulator)